MRLSDVRAVVTGAARGLGRHFTLAILREGGKVMAGDVNPAGLRDLKAEAAAAGLGDGLQLATVDIANEAQVTAFVDSAAQKLGGINVLINNAALLRDGLLVAEEEGAGVRKLPALQWNRLIDVNLSGQFLVAREVAAKMIEGRRRHGGQDGQDGQGGGVIVNISSLARIGNAGQSHYSASKAGLDACTRSWAQELAHYGIRVGGVAPGVIDTPMLESISDDALRGLREAIPLGRIGKPEEIWLAVRFILECEFFTGRTLEVDGGAAM